MNTDHPSSDGDLKILNNFLGAFDVAALAHARVDLTDQEKRDIEDLARGELSAGQRSSLVPLLARNENAIELLAEHLRKDR